MQIDEFKVVWSKIQQGDFMSLLQDIDAECAHHFQQQNQEQQQLDDVTRALDVNRNGILDKVMAQISLLVNHCNRP